MNWFNSTNAKEIGTIYLIFAVFAGMMIMLALYFARCWENQLLSIIPVFLIGKNFYSIFRSAVISITQRLHARVFKDNFTITHYLILFYLFRSKSLMLSYTRFMIVRLLRVYLSKYLNFHFFYFHSHPSIKGKMGFKEGVGVSLPFMGYGGGRGYYSPRAFRGGFPSSSSFSSAFLRSVFKKDSSPFHFISFHFIFIHPYFFIRIMI